MQADAVILQDITIIFALSTSLVLVFHRFKLPPVVGFLLAGIIAGPHGLALVKSSHEVEILAEIGVVLLLFTIGVEFSFEQLLKIKRLVLLGGVLQVGLTAVLSTVAAHLLFGLELEPSIFLGLIAALSSTVIVIKSLQDKGLVDTPHGRASLGILIFQDLAIVPMILLVPALAGAGRGLLETVAIPIFKGAAIVALVVVSARVLVPKILFSVVRIRSREAFILTVILIGLSIALLTSGAGLSLALGAFLAGLIISESEYGHQTLGNVVPFRDVFSSFFFVSVGMLVNLGFLVEHIGMVLVVTVAIVVLKGSIASIAILVLGYPLRSAVSTGLALTQIGEFSFILAQLGLGSGLLNHETYQVILGVAIFTMAATPFLIDAGIGLGNWLHRRDWVPLRLKAGQIEAKSAPQLNDHLLVIGYGFTGQSLVRAAEAVDIPYLVIDMNPETTKQLVKAGKPALFGDAANKEILDHTGARKARVAVVAINDAAATRRIVEVLRQFSPSIYIMARTPYVTEMSPLAELGANMVIPQEFETSVEIFSRVLNQYLVPRDRILALAAEQRNEGYKLFRDAPMPKAGAVSNGGARRLTLPVELPDTEILTLTVAPGCALEGRTLGEIELRQEYGVSVLALIRERKAIPNPESATRLRSGDRTVIMGRHSSIARAAHLWKESPSPIG